MLQARINKSWLTFYFLCFSVEGDFFKHKFKTFNLCIFLQKEKKQNLHFIVRSKQAITLSCITVYMYNYWCCMNDYKKITTFYQYSNTSYQYVNHCLKVQHHWTPLLICLKFEQQFDQYDQMAEFFMLSSGEKRTSRNFIISDITSSLEPWVSSGDTIVEILHNLNLNASSFKVDDDPVLWSNVPFLCLFFTSWLWHVMAKCHVRCRTIVVSTFARYFSQISQQLCLINMSSLLHAYAVQRIFLLNFVSLTICTSSSSTNFSWPLWHLYKISSWEKCPSLPALPICWISVSISRGKP